jgi:hypothetical protein
MSRSFTLAIIGAFLLTLPVVAHHSHGNYNMTEYTLLQGTIKEVHWLVPHSWVYLDVKNEKGEVDTWALEGAGSNSLLRQGWTKDMLKAGDTISVRCHRLKDDSTGCLLGFITISDGKERIFD